MKIKANKAYLERKERLKDVLKIQSHSSDEVAMDKFILAQLDKIPGLSVYHHENNIYVTKGVVSKDEWYPCSVSHKDTVHHIIKQYAVLEMNGHFLAMDVEKVEQTGIGGDDKVGIFATLELLRSRDKIKAVFFSQEEIGCVGSKKLDDSFFKDIGYVFQCDRKEYGEFVNNIGSIELYSDTFSKAIADIITKYGFKEHDGGMTDVQSIKHKHDICVANMSCGYYRPHSSTEVVNIYEAMQTLKMVNELMDTLGNKLYAHKYEAPKVTYMHNYNYGRHSNMYNDWDTTQSKKWNKKNNKAKHKNDAAQPNSGSSYKTLWHCALCGIDKTWNIKRQIFDCTTCDRPNHSDEKVAGSNVLNTFEQGSSFKTAHDFRCFHCDSLVFQEVRGLRYCATCGSSEQNHHASIMGL